MKKASIMKVHRQICCSHCLQRNPHKNFSPTLKKSQTKVNATLEHNWDRIIWDQYLHKKQG